MSLSIGIIGLPRSGKTTIFNALTRGKADTSVQVANIGVAKVPDPRLKTLADMLHPHHIVPAEVKYLDIVAPARASAKGIGGKYLLELSEVDALINVVRAFRDDSIPHVEGSLDVPRDIAAMNMELTFSDLAIIERRMERLEASLKGARQPERPALLREQSLLQKLKADLEKETPIRGMSLLPEEAKSISGYQFLTAKPLLLVVNIGEEQLAQAGSLEADLNTRYGKTDCRVVVLCGKLEMELTQLDDEAARVFRSDYGIAEPGLERVIRTSYALLGLISFFTIASGEVRAWGIPHGTEAVRAAGKIHSDMERGFIRAEVISFTDLVNCGSIAEARKKGLLRLEGKTYTVQDGDVITFLFNV